MPKDEIKTLIRLSKLTLDEKRKIVVTIETEIARVEKEKAALLARLEAEKQQAQNVGEGGLTLGAFIKATFKKRDQFDHQLSELAKVLEAAQDELRLAFEELKRFEIAKEQRDKLQARDEARRLTKQLDEVGATRKRRASE